MNVTLGCNVATSVVKLNVALVPVVCVAVVLNATVTELPVETIRGTRVCGKSVMNNGCATEFVTEIKVVSIRAMMLVLRC
jgi:hypothetical protein